MSYPTDYTVFGPIGSYKEYVQIIEAKLVGSGVQHVRRFTGDTYPMVWEFFPHDLETVVSATLTYKKLDGSTVGIAGTVEDVLKGLISFHIGATDFSEVGRVIFTIKVSYDDGTYRTFIKSALQILGTI